MRPKLLGHHAGLESVGQANFDWIVREVADLAIAKTKLYPQVPELRGAAFLGAEPAPAKVVKKSAAKKTPAQKKSA